MNSSAPLTGSHLRTYQTIFQHPLSHNLGWHDVYALFRHLGQVDEEPNGNFKVMRHGQVLILHPARTKDVAETDELMALRHFLERSATPPSLAKGSDAHWLLVIDHHEARIFRADVNGGQPQQVLPPDPSEHFRQTHHAKDFSLGREKPNPNRFFEPIVQALQAAGPILILGGGTGTSSEMEQFVAWAKLQHPELAKRIIGTLVVDEHHLTEGELRAKAREFYATVPATLP